MNAPRGDRPSVRRALPLPLGALALAVALGCGAEAPPTPAPGPAQATGIATDPLKVGGILPPLEAEGWVNGPPPEPGAPGVRLHVVDVWGIWCPYCAQSAPGLARLHKKYSPRGVAFVSITNTDLAVVSNFVKAHSIPWPHGYGATARHVAALGAGSGMSGPAFYEVAPTLYLAGPDRRVLWVDQRGRERHQNPQDWERMVDAAIAEALGPGAKP
jgi:thiol-disulfide isomerase/thioredoxin